MRLRRSTTRPICSTPRDSRLKLRKSHPKIPSTLQKGVSSVLRQFLEFSVYIEVCFFFFSLNVGKQNNFGIANFECQNNFSLPPVALWGCRAFWSWVRNDLQVEILDTPYHCQTVIIIITELSHHQELPPGWYIGLDTIDYRQIVKVSYHTMIIVKSSSWSPFWPVVRKPLQLSGSINLLSSSLYSFL